MCSNLRQVVLAARTGSTGPRSLERLWAALSPFERGQIEREVVALTARGVRGVLVDGAAPLFHVGPFESIGPSVVAVCAPPEARAEATRLAEHAARLAVAAGATVLASDTAGAEAAALRAALAAGGTAVSVLAEGIPNRPPDHPGLVTVTPCAPGQRWTIGSAMARNATIAGMCTALVAIGAAGSGATLDAGMRALAEGRPVLAVGATSGSRLLVDYGATPAIDEVELAWWLDTRLASQRPPAIRLTGPGVTGGGRGLGLDTAVRVRETAIHRPAVRHRPLRQWSTA